MSLLAKCAESDRRSTFTSCCVSQPVARLGMRNFFLRTLSTLVASVTPILRVVSHPPSISHRDPSSSFERRHTRPQPLRQGRKAGRQ